MLKLFKSKIFIKQFISYMLIISITFFIISFVFMKTTKTSLQNQQLYTVENYRIEAIEAINCWLKSRELDLKNQAMYIAQLNDDKVYSNEVTDILKKQVDLDDSIVDILVLDEKGRIINSVVGRTDTDLSARDYFINGMNGKSTVTGFYKGAKTGIPIMAIGEPVIKNNNIKYVVATIIELEKIKDLVEKLDFGDWGHGYLVDSEGTFITSSNYIDDFIKNKGIEEKEKYKVSSKGVSKVLDKKSGQEIYTDFNGKKVFGSYEWLESLQVGFIVEFDFDKAMQPINRLGSLIRMLTFIVMLVGSILAYFISKRIVNPINNLISSTQSIIDGNYNEPINFDAKDELASLVKNFNIMQCIIHEREAELQKQNEILAIQTIHATEASKLKSEFLSNISHEFRTPLNSIIGFTNRVIKKSGAELPEGQLENLKIAKQEAYHLLDLINNLLDLAKIESGKMEIHREEFSLNELILEISSLAKILIDEKSLEFKVKLEAGEDAFIFSDKVKIKQILLNLISNAIKYSERGVITLQLNRLDDKYKVDVIDEGIGIAPEHLEKIFEEFRQVDGSYTRKAEGSGLGLSIVKRFTDILAGKVEVSSTLGTGSCFTIYFPIEGYEKGSH